jgi:hypothetical protein
MYTAAPNIIDVIRIDPMRLLAWQLFIAVGQADKYSSKVRGEGWVRETLLAQPRNQNMNLHADGKIIAIDLPHPEYMFGINSKDGRFELQQGARFPNVAELEGRMLLATGYHRTFAHSRNVMNAPEATDRAVLLALTTNLPFPDTPENQGLKAMLLGLRPPFFADFFDVRLFMPVKLRKRRYEMRIHVDVVGVDEAS